MDVPNPPFRTVSEELLYNIYLKVRGGGNMPGLTRDDINTLTKLNAILQDADLMTAEQIARSIAVLKGDVPVVANSLEKLYNIIQGITALKREDIDTIEELNAILRNADLVRIDDLVKALAALNLLKRRTIQFYFADDHWKEDHHHNNDRATHVLRGRIDSLVQDLSDNLSEVKYKIRLDNSSKWVDHESLSSLQDWISNLITGDELTGIKYWIKCIAQNKPGRDGEAINLFTYDAS
jgi:hypothetical protein